MRLTHLEIKNFMSYREVSVDLDNRGLVLVIGQNDTSKALSSNGAGKTAMAEAIYWCLFGKPLRDIPASSVINNRVNDPCEVTLSLVDGKTKYTLVRQRSQTMSGSRFSVTSNKKTVSGDAAQQIVEKLMSGMTPDQFGNFVFFGRDYKIKLFHEMSDADRKAMFETVCPELVTLTKMEDKVKQKIKELETSITTQHNDIVTAMAHVDSQKAYLERLKQEYLRTVERHKTALEDASTKAAEARTALELLKPVPKPPEISHDPKYRELKQASDSAWQNEGEAQAKLTAAKKAYYALSSPPPEKCPTCGQPWPCKDTYSAKHRLDTELAYKQASGRLTTCVGIRDKAEAALQAYTKVVDKKASEYDLYSRTVTKLQNISKNVEEYKDKLVADHKIDSASRETEILELDTKVQQQQVEVDNRQLKLRKTHLNIQEHKVLRDVVSSTGLKGYLLDELLAKLETEANKMSQYLANGELDISISASKEGDFRKREGSIVIRAENSQGADIYGGNSSGEKTRVDLCIIFGLISAVKDLYGVDVEFLFLDEVLDSLDDAGVEAVVELLKQEILPIKKTVFLTSHNDSLKGLFNETITVRKHHGFSEVYQ